MDFQKKVNRVIELSREIKEREDELTALFGGAPAKRTWTRRTPPAEQKEGPA